MSKKLMSDLDSELEVSEKEKEKEAIFLSNENHTGLVDVNTGWCNICDKVCNIHTD